MTPSITAILIVKNEEKHLAACLGTVKGWVDEILVYDSGSNDQTAEIAASFGARFIADTDWQGFGVQRQRAQTHVRTDWCLWLDADERITPELKENILKALSEPPENTIFTFPRLTWAFGTFIRHCGWYPDRVLRLYPRTLTRYNDALVHENVEVGPGMRVRPLKGDLLHFSFESLEHYLTKSARYAAAWAEGKASQGHRATLLQAFFHAAFRFFNMYILKRGFLDGRVGLLLSGLSTQYTFAKYISLWMYAQPKRPD